MGVVLALLAALLFALAGAGQQRAASRVLNCARGPRRALELIRTPLWAAGVAADALGFVAQAGAVHRGALSVVQPLLVMTLLFSLPLAAIGGPRRPRWMDWAAASAACAGLAAVCAVEGTADGSAPDSTRLLAGSVVLCCASAALVHRARRTHRARAVLLSVAAGTLFAVGAALTKLVCAVVAADGPSAALGSWPLYGLVAASVAGFVLQQRAFAVGSLPATMTALTITEPAVSYGLGMLGFGERGPQGPGALLLTLTGVTLLCAGIAVLARSPLLRDDASGAQRSSRAAVAGTSASRFDSSWMTIAISRSLVSFSWKWWAQSRRSSPEAIVART